MWIEAFEAKYEGKGTLFGRDEFDKLLGHCAAVTDAPCCDFGPELIDAYPEAKVVLVQREFSAWYKSFSIIAEDSFNPVFKIAAILDPYWTGRARKMAFLWLSGRYGRSSQEIKDNLRRVYDEHHATIRRVTPPQKLLEYELGSGWEPLCKFLDKPIPDVPFPWLNEGERLKEFFKFLEKRVATNALKNVMVVFGSLAILGYAVYWVTARNW
jgi:hypothetical protein